MTRMSARSMMAALALTILSVTPQVMAQGESQTGTPVLVFGNTGLSGRNLLLGGEITSTATTFTHGSLAQGFTVGTTAYKVESVDVGLYLSNQLPNLKIDLFSSTSDGENQVPGQALGSFVTTAPANNGGAFSPNAIRTYNFTYAGNTTLTPGTNYWIVVSYTPQDGSAPIFNWHYAASGPNGGTGSTAIPGGLSGSGINYLGTMGTHEFGGEWLNHQVGSTFPHGGLQVGLYGSIPPVINPDGGPDLPDSNLPCYALSKGYFKNKFPSGWPITVIEAGGMEIGGRPFTTAQLRTMVGTNSSGGNQIGQLASQLIAVKLSVELARLQQPGTSGWAPDSDEVKAALELAEFAIAETAGFDSQGRLTGTLRGSTTVNGVTVSTLIGILDDGYIGRFHCDGLIGGGSGDGADDDDDKDKAGKGKKGKGKKGKGKGDSHKKCEKDH
jgi:hypothetical protein